MWLLTIFALVAFASSAMACSVPVFRYALEHWNADACQAVIFYRGALTPEQEALARDLGPEGLAGELKANLVVHRLDVGQDLPPDAGTYWQEDTKRPLPWLAVNFPQGSRAKELIWAGPLNRQSLKRLLDSPARQQVSQRLGQGESAVWVMIESGDKAKDEATAELLKTRLGYLMENLELPKLEAQDIANGLVSVGQEGLRLAFSTIRLSRSDDEEQAFIRMLLGTEAGLLDTKEPVVFPVFGRGRSLYALVGQGIRRETIDQAATFLIGKCSCQVKDQNPGVDLLMGAHWDKMLQTQSAALPDLPSLKELVEAAPVTVKIEGAATADVAQVEAEEEATLPSPASGAKRSPVYLAVIALLAGLFGLAALMGRKK